VFGVRLGAVGRTAFEAKVREATATDPLLSSLSDVMLRARAALCDEYKRLHKLLVQTVARDEVRLLERSKTIWSKQLTERLTIGLIQGASLS
jgi:hypothetical protein